MTAFNCRSYSYTASSSTCRLSGDDTISTGPDSIAPAAGTIFYQKAPCVDRKYAARARRRVDRQAGRRSVLNPIYFISST